jgi:hypothetical protein
MCVPLPAASPLVLVQCKLRRALLIIALLANTEIGTKAAVGFRRYFLGDSLVRRYIEQQSALLGSNKAPLWRGSGMHQRALCWVVLAALPTATPAALRLQYQHRGGTTPSPRLRR